MELNFSEIEHKWKAYWHKNNTFGVEENNKPKYYILDMFPYPSGAGLHVGHPLGYIASDILARYKRMNGFNVLHPMGFDAFGLPAEQYAIDTGRHPAETTKENISRYKAQLDKIGFSYDWKREVITADPKYYKWTQWIFIQLFESFFNRKTNKAEPIQFLISSFEKIGNVEHPIPGNDKQKFTAQEWQNYSESEKRSILMQYRLAYLSYAEVNWCEALGTVLANDEVINGVSERGGHPVVKKKMEQWFLRITDYADRLLEGLTKLDWSQSIKDMQTNWIGKSLGAQIEFSIENHSEKIAIFTTRPDTIFGVSFMVLAPELELIKTISSPEQKEKVLNYMSYVQGRSEKERMTEVNNITGIFTGAYAVHPFTDEKIPIWISEYVLAGYGTGAIMAVPSGDDRDFKFAQHFKIPIKNIFGEAFSHEKAYTEKTGKLYNSSFLDGLTIEEATPIVIAELEKKGIGTKKTNYRFRDAGFSRQRYWGEPFPIIYEDHTPYTTLEKNIESLPTELPEAKTYAPSPDGRGPLANLTDWLEFSDGKWREANTMPGYAGSSWYFMRYTDPNNEKEFASEKALDYWKNVDVYFGGAEHAVGHLMYSRMWTKVLFDLGYIQYDEPFQKLVNQGMIQGTSKLVYRIRNTKKFVSFNQKEKYETDPIHVDVNMVDGDKLNIELFKNWREEYLKSEFICESNGDFICDSQVEKMSKRYHNVVNPDDMVEQYGADVFRMYEMFLGPLEMSKPWDTKGIEGVSRFFKKMWRLVYDENGPRAFSHDPLNPEELKTCHAHIKKIQSDCETYAYNTAVSQFMIFVNEMSKWTVQKKDAIDILTLTIAPFAPHTAEQFWQDALNYSGSVFDAPFPIFDEKYLVENSKVYPIAINGKPRAEIEFPLEMDAAEIEKAVLSHEVVLKWLEEKSLKKFIYVKGRMINVVIS